MCGSSIAPAGRTICASLPDAELRRLRGDDIAMVFQDPSSSLNPVHRIGDQIAEAIRAHRDTTRAAASAQARHAC